MMALRDMSVSASQRREQANRDNSFFLSDHPMPSKQSTGRRGFGVRMMNRHLQRWPGLPSRSEEHTSELQSQSNLVCRLLLEKKKNTLTLPIRVRSQYEHSD